MQDVTKSKSKNDLTKVRVEEHGVLQYYCSRYGTLFIACSVCVFCLQVKKSAAMTEKAWKGCGQKVGIKIWRIVKFKASMYL